MDIRKQYIMKISKFNNPFMALKHRNFRYFWIGQSVSLIGTWMQNISQSWLVYTLTDSPFLLGLTGTLQFAPMLFLSLFAGAILDKVPKRKVLLITQSVNMTLALILSILVLTDCVKYWHVLIMATLLGLSNTFDMPARQAIVIELVGISDVMNAVSLNSTVFNTARIIGPMSAAFVMAKAGIGFCFLINSISYIPVIYGLFKINTAVIIANSKKKGSLFKDVYDGLVYIARNKILLKTLLIMAIIGTFAMNTSVLVPVFARVVLNKDAAGYGFLMSFMGFGSLIGALAMASRSASGPKKLIMNAFPFIIACTLILTGSSSNFYLAGLSLAMTGFFFICFTNTTNSIMQLNSKDEFRGRVMSAYTLVFGGSTPLGNLFAGSIAQVSGPRLGFILCGGAIIVSMLFLFLIRIGTKANVKVENKVIDGIINQ